nr:MAG TPA: zinc finger domain protein [Caudoviricetes sp.]
MKGKRGTCRINRHAFVCSFCTCRYPRSAGACQPVRCCV